ncbi:hypothetical protein BKA67DRAFT_515839 [Truncatella angustata]|uniref:DUF7924 domain-containing protein n=1 Tax=Truncatella angustata TaxID=152316 RepID=A0A9P8UPJ9_9PEZI|nr:uncharacterized protein BKA67DRAFT_515839 [Truncatella angustata]KAH6655965.1 hypothetical protein BKA67DRAFT_515839 [Truncatella angustata]
MTHKRQRRATFHKSSHHPPILGRHRDGQTIESAPESSPKPPHKPPPISRPPASDDAIGNTAAGNVELNNPIEFWAREGLWPPRLFEPDVDHLLARKRSLSALGGCNDQKPREEKSAQYRDQRYETLLATKGSFMVESSLDITLPSKVQTQSLLDESQPPPQDTLFRDDVFKQTYRKIHNKNEARIIQDVSRLIVPSAESLAAFDGEHLEVLIESVNEGWNNSIPLTGTRPQPDYSVGFQRDAFTQEQLEKLSPFISDFIAGDLSYFMATYYMYFPFLACEVKCGAAALDVADSQNAHSMTLAARGIVELFRLVGREDDVNREILAFSISHDNRSVRIYGHYPVMNRKETKYYRYPIHTIDFTALNGKVKWTSYQFTRNVYDTWMPAHFKRICLAIDQLPSKADFDVQALSESASPSQGEEHLARSMADAASLLVDMDNQSNKAGQMDTPATSFSKPGPSKRRKSPAKKPSK